MLMSTIINHSWTPLSLTHQRLLISPILLTQEILQQNLQMHKYSPWRTNIKTISKVNVSPVENTMCLSFLQLSCEMSALMLQAIVVVTKWLKRMLAFKIFENFNRFLEYFNLQQQEMNSRSICNAEHGVNHSLADGLIHMRKNSAFGKKR